MPKLAVYDAENKARLLGFLHYDRDIPGEIISFAAVPPLDFLLYPFHEPQEEINSPRQSKADFRKVWIHNVEEVSNSPWFREQRRRSKVVLTTSASLSVLTCIREFELPKLSDRDTDEAEKEGAQVEANSAFY